jgi:Rhomboid family
VVSGLAAWFFGSSDSVGAGASGVVFGYFGYIIVRGLFDRHAIDVLVGAVMALCFAYQFTVLLPHAGIGWQAHIGGLVGGIAGGWLLRDRRAPDADAVTAGAGTESGRVGQTSPGRSLTRPGKTQPGPATPDGGPRAELYKQLDDMGL